jgi:dihydroorotate dehydrogenase electron transfer subunit
MYKIVGKATNLLAKMGSGEYINIIGPLGNGFSMPAKKGSKIALIGGGTAVAPILFLAHWLNTQYNVELSSFIGARTKSSILKEEEFATLANKLYLATNDGSRGYKGDVTQLLSDKLRQGVKFDMLYAAGPRGMLEAVNRLAEKFNVEAEVCWEEYMACGMGLCRSCAVKVLKDAEAVYVRTCCEGPVFNRRQILWQ